MKWFRTRDDKVGLLKAKLSVAFAHKNAAQQRADRLERDLRDVTAKLDHAKEMSAVRRGRIEHLEEQIGRLEYHNSELEKALRGVAELKAAVGKARVPSFGLGVEDNGSYEPLVWPGHCSHGDTYDHGPVRRDSGELTQ